MTGISMPWEYTGSVSHVLASQMNVRRYRRDRRIASRIVIFFMDGYLFLLVIYAYPARMSKPAEKRTRVGSSGTGQTGLFGGLVSVLLQVVEL